MVCCTYEIAAEQKARSTYDNLLRLIDDPDVRDPIKFLRQREVTHFQRFGEAKRFGKQKTARSFRNRRLKCENLLGSLCSADCFDHHRSNLEQVAADAVVCYVEEKTARSFRNRRLKCENLLGSLCSADCFDHHRSNLEQVAADAVVCYVEDRSSIVLVNSNDALGILHTSLVLDCAGDTQSNIQLRMYGLAGLTNLMVSRQPAGVDCCTGTANNAAELSSQRSPLRRRSEQHRSC